MTSTNVHSLNTEIQYIPVDVLKINTSLEAMITLSSEATLSFGKSQYLPSLYQKASLLYPSAGIARKVIAETSAQMVLELEKVIRQLQKFQVEGDAASSAEDKEDNLYFRARERSKAVTCTTKCLDRMKVAARDLNVGFNSETTSGYLTGLQTEAQNYQTELQKIEADIASFSEERKLLSDAMKALESTNFVSIAKDTLLTVENVSALAIAAPQAEIIRLAMEHLKKTLDGIQETLNYMGLLNQRERLVSKIRLKEQERLELKSTSDLVTEKVKMITAIHGLYSNVVIIGEELANVVNSVGSFLAVIEADHEDALVQETQLLSAAPYLIAYLRDIR